LLRDDLPDRATALSTNEQRQKLKNGEKNELESQMQNSGFHVRNNKLGVRLPYC
jgi:hypothetical protein